MFNKILTLCLAMCLVFTSAGITADAEATETADAYFSVESGSQSSLNIEVMATSGVAPVMTQIDSEYAWKVNNDTASKLLFDIDETMENSLVDGSSYIIEIEYYDYTATISDLSFFSIWVDKLNYGMQRICDVSLVGDGAWKKAVIEVEDAAFGCNTEIEAEADIMIRLYDRRGSDDAASAQPLYFKSIEVTRLTAKNPVLLESYIENAGNTFAYTEAKQVKNTFTNTKAEDVSLKAEYSMIDGYGDVKFSFSEKFTVPAGQAIDRIVTIDSRECGVFRWIVKVSDDTGAINSRFLEDTLAIVKTAEDGLKNEAAWIVSHLERYRDNSSVGAWKMLTTEQSDCIEMIKKANIKGTRLQTTWYLTEYTKNNLNVEGTYYWNAAKHLNDAGVDFWVMLSGCATGYSDHTHVPRKMPATEAEVNGWEAFCKHVIEKYANTYGVDLFEIWNEPNVNYFNEPNPDTLERGDAVDLAEITKRAKKAANELLEENKISAPVKIAGLSVTELNNNDTYDNWLKPAVTAGIVGGEYGMDMLNVHTYTHDIMPESGKVYNSVQKYRNYIKTATGGEVSDIPVLISEYGNAITDKVSAEEQKDWNIRSAILYRMMGFGDNVAIYNLERKGSITGSGDDHYGIISPFVKELNIEGKCGIPTESYIAYAAMNYVLRGDVAPVKMLDCGENVRINHLKRNDLGDDALVMWTAFNDAEVTLDLGVNSVKYYDEFGNEKNMTSNDGRYKVLLDGSVSYITGNFAKTEVALAENQVIYEDFSDFTGNPWAPEGWTKTTIEDTVTTGCFLLPFTDVDYGKGMRLGSSSRTDENGNTVYGNHALYKDFSYIAEDENLPVKFHTDIRIIRDNSGADGENYAENNEYRACVVRSSDVEDTVFGFKLIGEVTGLINKSDVVYVYYWDETVGDFVKSDTYISLGSWATLEAVYYPETGKVKYYVTRLQNNTMVKTCINENNAATAVLDENNVLSKVLVAAQTTHGEHLCSAVFDNIFLMPYDEAENPVFFIEKEHSRDDTTVCFETTAINQFALTDTLSIIATFYDDSDRLVKVEEIPVELTGNKLQSISTGAISVPTDNAKARFFIWNTEGLKPLSAKYKVGYN